MSPQINLVVAAERRAQLVRAAGPAARHDRHRRVLPSLRFKPAAQPLACCA